MQCQLCVRFGDPCCNFNGLPIESLEKHSKIHQAQIDRISKDAPTSRLWKWKILTRCFPSVNVSSDCTKSKNVEAETVVRHRRKFPNDPKDRNNRNSKKKRFQDKLEDVKQGNASSVSRLNAEQPRKCDTISKQHSREPRTIKSDSVSKHGYVLIRRYCNELKRRFGRNGKLTCRQCSKELTVVAGTEIAVDHVTRSHFGRELYACRLCSKRYTSYRSLGPHVYYVHHKSLADAFIDVSEEYENEIMELMRKCYGTAAKKKDGSGSNTDSDNRITFPIRSCYRDLKQKFGRDGKLNCRLCPKKVHVNLPGVVSHIAGNHFRKTLFTCRLCSKGYSTYGGVVGHIVNIHGLRVTGNYNCHTERYEKEIIELMIMCFGGNEKTGNEQQSGV